MFAREKASNDLLNGDGSQVLSSHRQLPRLANDFLCGEYMHFGLRLEEIVRPFVLHITREMGNAEQ